jgi:type I restriction enzyme S subunit
MAGEWTRLPLEDCMEAIIDYRGKTPKKASSGIPLITAKVVKGGRIETPDEFIAVDDYDAWMRRGLPKAGDIVMTTEAPLGEVAQLGTERVALAQRIIALRGKKGLLDNDFLKFLMQSEDVQKQLRARATGTTVLGIKQTELRKVFLTLPPLPEQRAIAHILGTLDDKIEVNRRMSQTLEAMARALFKAWFVDFEPVRAKLEGRWQRGQSLPGLPAHLYDLFPDRLVDSELGEIPEGWRVGTLGDLSEKPQYGYTASAKEEPVGPKFLRITDINKLPWIDWTTVPYCEIEPEDFEQYRLHSGDVLIARMADPGHGVVIEEQVEAVFASYLIRFRLKDQAYIRYIQYWLRSDGYWELVTSRHAGTTRASLNAQVLSSFQLIIPPKPIASAFSEIVNALRNKVVAAVNESRTLAALRDALLPKLISGEIRVKDAKRFLGRAM